MTPEEVGFAFALKCEHGPKKGICGWCLKDAIAAALAEERSKLDPSVVALVACANCTHQPDGDAACAACIAAAIRGRSR